MHEVDIFIDEFGNTHLDLSKQGAFSHFVYTAIVIKHKDIQDAYNLRYRISKKYLQGSPIKSSSKAFSNDNKGFNKRIQALKELRELNFSIFTLVVDKNKIDSVGLGYRQVFYKYFSKIFVKEFTKHFDSFKIYADKLGYPEFQRSLKRYIYENAVQKDLFHPDRSYDLADDKYEEPLVQLADFLAGCVGKIFCASHSHSRSQELFDLLHDRLHIDYFPYKNKYYEGSIPSDNKRLGQEIGKIAYKVADEFLQSSDKEKVSPEAREVLRYLMMMFQSFPERLIETHEIVYRIHAFNPDYSKEMFRSDIQSLRDRGILIASIMGKSGYKIPYNEEDMIGFYNRYMRYIIPMLKRVEIADTVLQKKSVNEINLLTSEFELAILKDLINVVNRR